MSGIFVSYRRACSSAVVYRLVDELKERFGDEAIFFDVESIEAGMAFDQAIRNALSKCSIALIVIGPQWADITDDSGHRRLDNENDWVRLEVNAALNSRARVIPLLVEGAEIPGQHELPTNIQELSKLQAFTINKSPEYWDFDVKRLEERLRKIDRKLPVQGGGGKIEPAESGRFSRKVVWGYVIAALFGLSLTSLPSDDDPLNTSYGFTVFFGLAFVLHLLGLSDINKGLTRGKGAAIGGLVLSVALSVVALVLGVVVDSMNTMDGGVEPDVAQQQTLPGTGRVAAYQNDTPSPPAEAQEQTVAAVQKPPFTPQQVDDSGTQYNAAGRADITGSWSSNIGASYQFGNNLNGTLFFYEFNALQVQVGFGEGGYQDGLFTFQYTNTLMQTTAVVQLQAVNNNLLRGTLYNQVTGQAVSNFELYR